MNCEIRDANHYSREMSPNSLYGNCNKNVKLLYFGQVSGIPCRRSTQHEVSMRCLDTGMSMFERVPQNEFQVLGIHAV